MKKKLIFVTEALWIGGIESALVNLLNALDYEKYDVTCLVLRASLEMAHRIPAKCRLLVADRERSVTFPEAYRHSRLYHLAEESSNPSRLHRALMWAVPAVKWVENRLYIRYIRRQLKKERFDTCVIYSDRAAETAVRAVKAARFLLFYHHGAMRRVYHDEIGYRRSEKIIAVSGGIAKKLQKQHPLYAHKIISIPNLIDEKSIAEKSMENIEEQFEEKSFHIVSCGRLAYEKGMDIAIEAANMLIQAGYDDFRWWIVGAGPEESKLRNQVERCDLQNYVTLVGMKENPYPYIAKADLYVQPSRVEAFGLTIAEAQVLGKPIVATDTEGAREVCANDENCCLCSADARSMAEHIAEKIRDPKTGRREAQGTEERNENALRSLYQLLA